MAPGAPAQSPEAKQRDLLETLLEQAEGDSQVDLVRLLGRFSRDPQEVAGVIIDAMSDAELVASLSSFTDISPEKLKSSSDPKALAHRLVDLAMESLVQLPNSGDSGAQGVYFSEALVEDPLQESSTRFTGDERILANFAMGDYRGKEIFVKWTRVDDPKIMLFNHYPIRAERDFNHVWLRPDEGWDPGEYQVNFYTADDSLAPTSSRPVLDRIESLTRRRELVCGREERVEPPYGRVIPSLF